MLNQLVMVGRLTKEPTIQKLENGKERSYITLAIPRSYKNSEGIYETDFISVILFDSIARNTCEYCKKGDLVGVKGRVQSRLIKEDDSNKNVMEVIAERITFLTSKKESEDDE